MALLPFLSRPLQGVRDWFSTRETYDARIEENISRSWTEAAAARSDAGTATTAANAASAAATAADEKATTALAASSTASATADAALTAATNAGSAAAAAERPLTAGSNVTIDRTNPAAPVISASAGGTTTVDGLTDATNVGKALAKAADGAAARNTIGLAAAAVVVVWSGTGFRLPGAGTDLGSRPSSNPLHLIGGTVSDRPSWANQDGDAHDATA